MKVRVKVLVGAELGMIFLEGTLATFTHTHIQTHILFDPIIILLGIYPVSYRIHTNTLLVALFIIAKNWKQPTCPSVGYRLN